jgi:hypothetical protein
MKFKHVTGKIIEVDKNIAAYQMYINSVSWKPYEPVEKEVNSIYSSMTKSELLEVAERLKVKVYSKWTKTEMIEAIEKESNNAIKLNIEFTDNLMR